MDEGRAQEQPLRRAGLRALPTPCDIDLHLDDDGLIQDAPPLLEVIDGLSAPRIPELDALLREVDKLRGTVRRDLSLAATAAAAGADDLAGWLLCNEGGEIRAFEQRALSHLGALEDHAAERVGAVSGRQRRARRMMPAAPLVAAAAAVIGVLTGIVPTTGGATTSPKTSNAALQSYAHLTELATNGASPSRISAAAQRFHADLAPLVAAANSNPAAAEKAIALLQTERALIAGEADSPALRAVLAQADALVRRLRATLPRTPVRPLIPVAPAPSQNDARRPSAAPKSSGQPASSPTAAPRSTPSARPSASPGPSRGSAQPTPSPSQGDTLPHTPGTLPA